MNSSHAAPRLVPGVKNQYITLTRMLFLAGLILVCSCKSVRYDLRRLEQPVLLNGNPFLASERVIRPSVIDVGQYSAEVSESEMTASSGYGSSTTRKAVNSAQTAAFAQIGGQPNRAIKNLSLEADFTGVNALLALMEEVSIKGNGQVMEVQLVTVTNSTGSMEGSSSP